MRINKDCYETFYFATVSCSLRLSPFLSCGSRLHGAHRSFTTTVTVSVCVSYVVCLPRRMAHFERPHRIENRAWWHHSVSKASATANAWHNDLLHTHYADDGTRSIGATLPINNRALRTAGRGVRN